MKKFFESDYLKNTLDLPDSEYAISDKIIDSDRWNIKHELLFICPEDGKVYQTFYRVGATEMQDEGPWEYDEVVEATEMELAAVIEKKYVPAGEAGRRMWGQNVDAFVDFLRHEDIYNDLSLYDIKAVLQSYASYNNEPTQEHIQETVTEPAVQTVLNQQPAETVSREAPSEAFLKFFEKLKKKLDEIFYLDTETTILQLDDTPSPDDSFTVYCSNGAELSYSLRDLYNQYTSNKDAGYLHPLKAIAKSIEEDYDKEEVEEEER